MAILKNRLTSAMVVDELTETSFTEEIETSESESPTLSGDSGKKLNQGEVSYIDPSLSGDGSDITVSVSNVKNMETTDNRAKVSESSNNHKGVTSKFKSSLANIKVESASDAVNLFNSIRCYTPKALELELPRYKSNLDRELGKVRLKCKDKNLESIINSYVDVIFKSYDNILNEVSESMGSGVTAVIDKVLDNEIGKFLKLTAGFATEDMKECLLYPTTKTLRDALLGKGSPLSIRASLSDSIKHGICIIGNIISGNVADIIKGVIGGAILKSVVGKPNRHDIIFAMLNNSEYSREKNVEYLTVSIKYVMLSEDTGDVKSKLSMFETISSLGVDNETNTGLSVLYKDMHEPIVRLILSDDSTQTTSSISDYELYIKVLYITNPRWYLDKDISGVEKNNYSIIKSSKKMKELAYTKIASNDISSVLIKADEDTDIEYIKETTEIDTDMGIYISTLSYVDIPRPKGYLSSSHIANDNTLISSNRPILHTRGYTTINSPYIHSKYNISSGEYYHNIKYEKCNRS